MSRIDFGFVLDEIGRNKPTRIGGLLDFTAASQTYSIIKQSHRHWLKAHNKANGAHIVFGRRVRTPCMVVWDVCVTVCICMCLTIPTKGWSVARMLLLLCAVKAITPRVRQIVMGPIKMQLCFDQLYSVQFEHVCWRPEHTSFPRLPELLLIEWCSYLCFHL